VLDGILGLLGIAQELAAEGEDRAVVTVICSLKRRQPALADQRDQTRIGRDA
jgi:hypothetical protein